MSAAARHARAALLLALGLMKAEPALAQRIAEVQIAPPYMRMVRDAQAQLVATVYDLDGIPVNVRLRWSSSNINVATISADGTVRAIAPGNVLITVAAEADGRRVVARATVYVMRPGQRPPSTVHVGPGRGQNPPGAPPPASATPPVSPTPGPAPAPRAMPAPMTMMRVDSMTRASINCNEPFLNAANPMRACYDTRASVRDSSFVPPERPGKDRCERGVGTVMVLVQVNEHGRVDGVLPFTASLCPEYTGAVVEAARRTVFNPAEKNGQPVRAWVQLRVRGDEVPRP